MNTSIQLQALAKGDEICHHREVVPDDSVISQVLCLLLWPSIYHDDKPPAIVMVTKDDDSNVQLTCWSLLNVPADRRGVTTRMIMDCHIQ